MDSQPPGGVVSHGSRQGSRKFYELPTGPTGAENPPEVSADHHSTHHQIDIPEESNGDIVNYIEKNVIGRKKVFSAPFGLREVTYCDYTASGRSLHFLEDYVRDNVLPEYGNTHTTSTVTALQTTLFRHEARDIIRNSVGASEHDAVIFVGSGCTAAVHKLIQALALTQPPVVFLGPYEHHSTMLPWRELGATTLRVRETPDGLVDVTHLEQLLQEWEKSGRELIGCFAAASNVTGTLVDVDQISICLHRHGALAFWDYATAGPYVDINMNPVATGSDQQYVYKDAVFISPHKFVGGVQTPGVLVAKKKLFRNQVPSNCGGGAVFFVRREGHRYLQEVEMREEAGTPAIVESVRAGLVFQLKDAVTTDVIMQREHEIVRLVTEGWQGCENLVILGNLAVPRLPVFSFLIRQPGTQLFLHHLYVTTILNDVFGIQTRGGCACAGPYAEDLLGINEDLAERFEHMLAEDSRLDRVHLRRYQEYSDREILRPGFVRVSIPFFMDTEAVQFVIEAVKLVAEHGWKLLPQYTFNPETGEWRHRSHQVFNDRRWLGHVSYKGGQCHVKQPPRQEKGPLPTDYQTANDLSFMVGIMAADGLVVKGASASAAMDCLKKAHEIFANAVKVRVPIGDQTLLFDEEAGPLRWFVLPSEVYPCLTDHSHAAKIKQHSPFIPATYPRTKDVSRSTEVAAAAPATPILLPGLVLPVGATIATTKCQIESEHTESHSSNKNRENIVDNSGQESRTVFAEGIKSDLNAGFINKIEDAPSEVCEKQSDPSNINGSQSQESAPPSLSSGETESSSTEQNGLQEDVNTSLSKIGADDDKTVICKDGSCFKKRPDNQAPPKPVPKSSWHSPPKSIFKPSVEALEEFEMIQDGDRVLICLSGGKDSLSLLHTVRQYQFYAKKKGINFEFGAVTIDPMTSSYDPSPLKGYLAQLGVPYFYEEQAILEAAANLGYEVASICSFCSRMKRGRIYHAARREKYNVLAFGQHLDDLAESFLMSVFHNGSMRTMKAHYKNREGDLRIIRPFVYVREVDLRKFAEEKKLPVIPENCPACFEAPKERHRMKQLLAVQEVIHPRLFFSLSSAMKPIMSINSVHHNTKTTFGAASDDSDNEDYVCAKK